MIAQAQTARPYGPWATFGLGLAVTVLIALSQVVGVVLLVAISEPLGLPVDLDELEHSGLALAVLTLCSGVASITSVCLLCVLRRGIALRDYLGLRPVAARAVLPFFLLGVLYVVAHDLTMLALDRPIVPDFVRQTFDSRGSLPLFLFAVVLVAPIAEEVFFRGFLLPGFAASRLGEWGAVLLTAGWFALMHLQYSAVEMISVLVVGVLLAVTRLRTGSLYPSIALHVMFNAVAMTEAALGM